MPNPLFSNHLSTLSHVKHGFFTREGGVSEGYLNSLNCNQKHDVLENVLENRKRVTKKLGGHTWVGVDQKHTADVVFVEKPFEGNSIIADAIVTSTPGLVISVLTADCAPILLADRQKSIVAAVHAGWQGAFAGIIQNTLKLMREKGAEDIVAAVGPCIHQESYEMGCEFDEKFANAIGAVDLRFDDYFKRNGDGKFQFDLATFVADILRFHKADVEPSRHNTYTDESRFFSYRRKTHLGEPFQGGQASAIMLI